MKDEIKLLRRNLLALCYKGGGHIGGSLSIIEILYTLYKYYLNNNQNDFILSKGHAAPALYTILNHFKIIDDNEYLTYGTFNTSLIHHPSSTVKGIIFSSGSIGLGLSVGNGMALANSKLLKNERSVFVLLGDGELCEGSILEAFTYGGSKKINNIIALIDKNNFQASDKTNKIVKTDIIIKAIKSLGWKIFVVDGHSIKQIKESIDKAISVNKPSLIVLNTVKGKGISFMENKVEWHHKKITEEIYINGYKELS